VLEISNGTPTSSNTSRIIFEKGESSLHASRRKKLLRMFLFIMLTTVALIGQGVVAGQEATRLSVYPQTTKADPGETFSINVTVADVSDLFGYQFVLNYSTTVLTAISFISYEPFTFEWPSGINDTEGYVSIAYTVAAGSTEGLTTVNPVPIAGIDFTVDAMGTSKLDILDIGNWTSRLVKSGGILVDHVVTDGFFVNVEVHDIAVTDVTASQTTLQPGDSVSIDVLVENQGDFQETFNVTAYYDAKLIGTQINVQLDVGANTNVTLTWDTTDVAKGTYTISAEAIVEVDDDPADNTRTGDTVTIQGSQTTGPGLILYVVAGVAIIIALAIGIYILRARKSEPT